MAAVEVDDRQAAGAPARPVLARAARAVGAAMGERRVHRAQRRAGRPPRRRGQQARRCRTRASPPAPGESRGNLARALAPAIRHGRREHHPQVQRGRSGRRGTRGRGRASRPRSSRGACAAARSRSGPGATTRRCQYCGMSSTSSSKNDRPDRARADDRHVAAQHVPAAAAARRAGWRAARGRRACARSGDAASSATSWRRPRRCLGVGPQRAQLEHREDAPGAARRARPR